MHMQILHMQILHMQNFPPNLQILQVRNMQILQVRIRKNRQKPLTVR